MKYAFYRYTTDNILFSFGVFVLVSYDITHINIYIYIYICKKIHSQHFLASKGRNTWIDFDLNCSVTFSSREFVPYLHIHINLYIFCVNLRMFLVHLLKR